jgi:predicted nicotinamide N-methyase
VQRPPTTIETIAPGGVTLLLERPVAPDELLDEERFAEDEFLPYWSELWPSGLALAELVATLPLDGTRVLELGCGLGVPSLVAAARGADVTAGDWAPEALELLRANAARNGLPLEPVLFDWRGPTIPGGRPFPLVLAADVLYERRNVGPVLAALTRLVAQDGEALVADPGRAHTSVFLQEAAEAGFGVETIAHGDLPRGGIHRCHRGRPAERPSADR